MTTFGLIRHGATEWNRLGKLQGQLDTNLTEEGREQARLLGKRFNAMDWDYILCSDLQRAVETARIISNESGIPLQGSDARLRERTFGLLEGTTLEDRLKRYGPDWKTLDLGVESDEDVYDRWTSLCAPLLKRYPNGNILIVSHGSYIGTVLRMLDLEKPDGYLTNSSLTQIEWKDGIWSCSLYSCTRHLQT